MWTAIILSLRKELFSQKPLQVYIFETALFIDPQDSKLDSLDSILELWDVWIKFELRVKTVNSPFRSTACPPPTNITTTSLQHQIKHSRWSHNVTAYRFLLTDGSIYQFWTIWISVFSGTAMSKGQSRSKSTAKSQKVTDQLLWKLHEQEGEKKAFANFVVCWLKHGMLSK